MITHSPAQASTARLRDLVNEVGIIAHKEDTRLLENALKHKGFAFRTFRGNYSFEQQQYASQIKTLINHANAWRYLKESQHPMIFVEADFVPVRNFGTLPVPFPIKHELGAQFGWLYSSGSILYGVNCRIFPHGHGNTMVAYIATPATATALLDFFDREMSMPEKGEYRLWDTYIGIFLRWERGIYNYIPVYQYGEHGGIPNPEHSRAGIRHWHQADILWSKLAFLPTYAHGNPFRYRVIRLRGWLRGWLRLFVMHFFSPNSVNSDSTRGRLFMAGFSLFRLVKMAHLLTPLAKGDGASHWP